LTGAPWPDPIPGVLHHGGLVLFSGASGAGKTVFVSEWCRNFLEHLPINGYPTNCPPSFCYIAADRPWDPTYADTFSNVGLGGIHRYSLADDDHEDPLHWTPESTFELIRRVFTKAAPQPGALVFVDPVAPLLIYGNQNDAKCCARTMHFYRRLIRQYDVTLLCMANVVKQKNDPASKHTRPEDRQSGSGALAAHSDTQVWLIDDDGADAPVRLGWKPRRGPRWEGEFTFDPTTKLFIPHTPLTDVGNTPAPDRPTQVLELLPDEGLRYTEWEERACNELNIGPKTFESHFSTLKKRSVIVKDIDGRWHRRKPS
jgi:hypothetical protein